MSPKCSAKVKKGASKKTTLASLKKELGDLRQELDEANERYNTLVTKPHVQSSNSGRGHATPSQGYGGTWSCSQCGTGCYYDGRCGDGPVLTCDCNKGTEGWYMDSRG